MELHSPPHMPQSSTTSHITCSVHHCHSPPPRTLSLDENTRRMFQGLHLEHLNIRRRLSQGRRRSQRRQRTGERVVALLSSDMRLLQAKNGVVASGPRRTQCEGVCLSLFARLVCVILASCVDVSRKFRRVTRVGVETGSAQPRTNSSNGARI